MESLGDGKQCGLSGKCVGRGQGRQRPDQKGLNARVWNLDLVLVGPRRAPEVGSSADWELHFRKGTLALKYK